MADGQNKESESGVLGRLAGRGEDALTRFMDELGRNPRVTDALGRAMSAKGRVDETTRKTLAQVGLAAADEVRDLRGQLERLEERLSKLEGGGGSRAGASAGGAGRTGRRPTTSTKSSGGTAPKAASGQRTRGGGSSSRTSKSAGEGSASDSS